MFLRSLVKLNNSISVRILPPNLGEDQKKKKNVFTTFWFYLSLEFRICCCQVGITCQKTEGCHTYFAPFSVRLEGALSPKIDAYELLYSDVHSKTFEEILIRT